MGNDRSNPELIDKYIATFPDAVQEALVKIRRAIKEVAPTAIEIIAYGIPTFWLNGNLVHFAGYQSHVGFYPTPSGMQAFKEELSKYETSKGTVRFPIDKPIPLPLIKKIVKYRVAENQKNSGRSKRQ